MVRFAPIILLLGILFNTICVVVFRLRLDRNYAKRFDDFSIKLEDRVKNMSADALSAIDSYFISNQFNRVLSDIPIVSDKNPVYEIVGDWAFEYSEISNESVASVGFRRYRVGDYFPRGGVITSIHPDGIVVDGNYWISNNNPSRGSLRSSLSRSDSSSDFLEQYRRITNDSRTNTSGQ